MLRRTPTRLILLFYIPLITALVALALAHPKCPELSTLGAAIRLKTCPRKQSVLCREREPSCALLVDDTSPDTYNTPWSHDPYCFAARDQDQDAPSPSAAETINTNATRFCVFTSDYFGSGGISIVARPDVASTVASVIQEMYNSDFPGPETVQNLNLEPAYRMVDMPEKGGKGLVATRRVARLETFMIDHASLIADASAWRALAPAQVEALLRRAVDQLLDPDRVLALSGGATADETGPLGRIVMTNNFLHEQGAWPQKILFPLISRLNHACRPNSFLRLSSNGLAAGISAFRDIEAGEEITLSYIPHFHTSAQRRAKIDEWGFRCGCELCAGSADALAASDRRRAAVARIGGDLGSAVQAYDLAAARKVLEDGLALLADEGVEAASGELLESLARVHWIAGDEGRAEQAARRAAGYADFGALEPRNRTAEIMDMLRAEG